MINKKAISPVIAASLLLVVAVAAVVNFQTFFNSFQSGIQTGVEKDSQGGVVDLNYLDPIKLYVVNPTNDTITYSDIKISGKSCGLSGNFTGSGISEIDLGFCTTDMSAGYKSVALITNKGIFAETLKMTSAGITGNITLQCTGTEIFSFEGSGTNVGYHAEIESINNLTSRLCVDHNTYSITNPTTCVTSKRLFYLGETNNSHIYIDNSTAYTPVGYNYNWQTICLESTGTVKLNFTLTDPNDGSICLAEYIQNDTYGGIVAGGNANGVCNTLTSPTNKIWLDIT